MPHIRNLIARFDKTKLDSPASVVQPAAIVQSLPAGWEALQDDAGLTYYVATTGLEQSTYVKPTAPAALPPPLPLGWSEAVEDGDRWYFWRSEDGLTYGCQWERPTEPAPSGGAQPISPESSALAHEEAVEEVEEKEEAAAGPEGEDPASEEALARMSAHLKIPIALVRAVAFLVAKEKEKAASSTSASASTLEDVTFEWECEALGCPGVNALDDNACSSCGTPLPLSTVPRLVRSKSAKARSLRNLAQAEMKARAARKLKEASRARDDVPDKKGWSWLRQHTTKPSKGVSFRRLAPTHKPMSELLGTFSSAAKAKTITAPATHGDNPWL